MQQEEDLVLVWMKTVPRCACLYCSFGRGDLRLEVHSVLHVSWECRWESPGTAESRGSICRGIMMPKYFLQSAWAGKLESYRKDLMAIEMRQAWGTRKTQGVILTFSTGEVLVPQYYLCSNFGVIMFHKSVCTCMIEGLRWDFTSKSHRIRLHFELP